MTCQHNKITLYTKDGGEFTYCILCHKLEYTGVRRKLSLGECVEGSKEPVKERRNPRRGIPGVR